METGDSTKVPNLSPGDGVRCPYCDKTGLHACDQLPFGLSARNPVHELEQRIDQLERENEQLARTVIDLIVVDFAPDPVNQN